MKTADQVIELKEVRSLFAHLVLICKSRPKVGIKEAVGMYEVSVAEIRSLFAPDGTMLHCSCKSSQAGFLWRCNIWSQYRAHRCARQGANVAQIAEIQSLGKPDFIKPCNRLPGRTLQQSSSAIIFTNTMTAKRVMFERYEARSSLKSDIRARREGSENPIYYHVTDTTHSHIGKVPLKKLLLHTKDQQETKEGE